MLNERQLRHLLEDAERIFGEAAYALLDVLCAQAKDAILHGDNVPALYQQAYQIYRDRLGDGWTREAVEAASEAVRKALARNLTQDLRGVKATLEDLPLSLRATLERSVANSIRGVVNIVWRDNLSMATAARTNYYSIVGRYVAMVNSGAINREEGVRRGVSALADRGVEVIDYASGVRSQADVAMRRHLYTQTYQSMARYTEELCLGYGVEYVEVDRTSAPRPSHARWEGRVYKLQGSEPGYPNFYEATGYKGLRGPNTSLADRLGGVNCGHTFAPYYPSVDEPHYADDPYTPEQKQERYDLTQRQRYYERQVRRWKRRSMLMEGNGVDATAERARVRSYESKIRDLVSANPGVLARDRRREKVYTPSSK